ncbi:MAG: hypothetical protein K2L75_04675, partial [Muribaculaceae bacterium]|nr:hypothetical protein [Muribaculaceae bacterium]
MLGRNDGTELSLGSFRLRFPADIEVGNLMMKQQGDTVIAAKRAHVDIKVLPLLSGKIVVKEAILSEARYRIGAPDSAMYMTIAADSIALVPASISLGNMDISLDNALIRGGRLGIWIGTDTTEAKEPSKPTKMRILVDRLKLDDFAYTMRLMPTIDTLSANIGSAVISHGDINLLNQTIGVGSFCGDGLKARYIAPDSTTIAQSGPYPAAKSSSAEDTIASAPWTVTIDSIAFTRSHALYTSSGVKPRPGLDFSFIEVDSLDLRLHNFYNQASSIRLPLSLRGTERCGVSLAVDGSLEIDSTGLYFKEMQLSTREGTALSF